MKMVEMWQKVRIDYKMNLLCNICDTKYVQQMRKPVTNFI